MRECEVCKLSLAILSLHCIKYGHRHRHQEGAFPVQVFLSTTTQPSLCNPFAMVAMSTPEKLVA